MHIQQLNKRCLLILCLLVFSLFISTDFDSLSVEEYQLDNFKISIPINLPKISTNVEQIVIDSDEDFITMEFPGNGTIDDPYVIDSYIVRPSLNESSEFYITNVTKHFIIQNCETEYIDGIILEGLNSGSATLRNNNVMRINLFYPAMIRKCFSIIDCSNVILANNTCDSNVNGIIVTNSQNITIANNTILNGINEPASDRRYCGLWVSETTNCSIYNNHFEEGGIYLDTSEDKIDSIHFANNTIRRWDLIESKYVETEILVLKNEFNVSVDVTDFGQVLIIKSTNITVSNFRFNNSFVGLSTFFSQNCHINNGLSYECQIGFLDYYSYSTDYQNLSCNKNVLGVKLIYSDSCKIDGLTSTESSFYEGISIDVNTRNTIVQNSNCSYNSWSTGILDSGLNSTFKDNFIEYNYIGIYLWSSRNSTLIGNGVNHNKNYGIYSSGTSNSLLFENSVSFNKNFGMYFTYSESGIISTNLIFGTEGYGVYLSSSTENFLVYRNSFINNEPAIGTSQAFDNGKNNYWYNPEVQIGNFWSDRGSKKTYSIDGDADNYDLYPLQDPIYYPDESYSWKISFPFFLGVLVFLVYGQIRVQEKIRKLKS